MPLAKSKFSLLVQAVVLSTQFSVLSVVPCKVTPPPLALASLAVAGLTGFASSIFLSANVTVVLLTVSVVPLTVRLPLTIKLPLAVVSTPFEPILVKLVKAVTALVI